MDAFVLSVARDYEGRQECALGKPQWLSPTTELNWRRFAIMNIPRHLFSEATSQAARRGAKKDR
jgi:hypothetical protein